jgi:hypothetical protein
MMESMFPGMIGGGGMQMQALMPPPGMMSGMGGVGGMGMNYGNFGSMSGGGYQ